ncbi:Fic family protein [Tunturiibacter gelidoferens]|uniref:Fic family protein n=1 Tax=Tunturiibacter lichenicola TaxID=2051959 RepID=A0A7Y9T351_9BACT|nr:Fic family protein [Edaphobacter lichenicola]NYF52453.1 Fic family protein [Edaphobacter lichenicola]
MPKDEKPANRSHYVTSTLSGERVRAFVPPPLPPSPKALDVASLQTILSEANQAVGRLDGMTSALPDLKLFLYSYVRKEAVLSSQIEGTQSSLSDLLLYENAETPGVPLDDVQEVSNYVAALNHGIKRMRDGFPLSLRLIREIHEVLLSKGRGSQAQPGQFRKSQNWIGGSRPGNAAYVPPPPEYVLDCMGQLETFIHQEGSSLPLLIRAGLVHAQFESIHPFLDGNGRVGRLLITFMLCAEEVLREPVLYLSLFFKKHRRLYYDRLNGTRGSEGWTEWLDFFLQGVRDTANQAVRTADSIDKLFRKDKEKIELFGRGAASALLIYRYAQANPLFSIKNAAGQMNVSFPTASSAVARMVQAGILRESSGKRRDRLFLYESYLDILNREF